MRYILSIVFFTLFVGCATWQGVKEDSKDAKDWTVKKVNQGATYVKEKTE